jgi:glycosyltransferase involved in cell wall biosynthesis
LSPGARADELRVMIVTDQYEPMIGGVPTVTRELARGLAERGHAVAVVAPSMSRHGRISPTGQAGQAEPITVAFRGSVRWPWYEGQRLGFLSASDARGLISVFAPDVAHIHSPLTLGLAARSAARRRGVPVLYTNHYLPANVHPSAPARPRSRAAALSGAIADAAFETAFYGYLTGFANRCDQVTAPTMTALRLLRDHGLRAPSQVVSNGVDLAAFSPEPPDSREEPELRRRYQLPAGAPLIMSAGRLSPEKQANVLIEAAARLGTDQAKAAQAAQASPVLAFAGTGRDEGRLRALAERLGVSGRVRFLGFVPGSDLPGLYRLADVFAIASQAELQSLVTMEAMASGLPVVAVDAGALGELVHAGENGFLIRPGQAAEEAAAMADCLGLLCRDHALRGRMSKASLRIIGNHDRYRVLDRWESIYRALAGRGTAEQKNRQR